MHLNNYSIVWTHIFPVNTLMPIQFCEAYNRSDSCNLILMIANCVIEEYGCHCLFAAYMHTLCQCVRPKCAEINESGCDFEILVYDFGFSECDRTMKSTDKRITFAIWVGLSARSRNKTKTETNLNSTKKEMWNLYQICKTNGTLLSVTSSSKEKKTLIMNKLKRKKLSDRYIKTNGSYRTAQTIFSLQKSFSSSTKFARIRNHYRERKK